MTKNASKTMLHCTDQVMLSVLTADRDCEGGGSALNGGDGGGGSVGGGC